MASISVILPNYRHALYLPRRIESILAQTRGDFELLILDDCSPDDSRTVIQRYASDPRVRLSFNETNSGNTFLQWRKGLVETKGEYVWIAESDDAAYPEFLEKLSAQLDANPHVGLATGISSTMDAQDRQTDRDYFDAWRRGGISTYDLDVFHHDFVMNGRDYLRRYMAPWNTLPNASAILFRRSAFDAIGGVSPDLRIAGDWMTYARILVESDIAWVAQPLNHFRQHGGSVGARLKGEPLMREGLVVERFIQSQVGRPPRAARRRGTDFKTQILMAVDRDGHGGKIPLRRIPAVVSRAASFDRAVLVHTLAMLAREGAASLLKRR
jgi:hypothetical protein